MSSKIEIAQPQSKSEALWCIHIAGSDDLVAMPSKPVAEAVARNFNPVWDRYGAERGHDVHAVAHVEPWMHGKEAHDKDLREHFHEYADLVLDEDSARFKHAQTVEPFGAYVVYDDGRTAFVKSGDGWPPTALGAKVTFCYAAPPSVEHAQPGESVDVKRADDLAVKLWNDFWEKKMDPKDTWRELRAAIAAIAHSRPTGDAKVLTTQAILDRIEAVARLAESAMQSKDEKHLRNTLGIIADDLTAIIAVERVPAATGGRACQHNWQDYSRANTVRCSLCESCAVAGHEARPFSGPATGGQAGEVNT